MGMSTKEKWEALAKETYAWQQRNFPETKKHPEWSILGIFEEVGELTHAHLKEAHGIRKTDWTAKKRDALGDATIFLMNGWAAGDEEDYLFDPMPFPYATDTENPDSQSPLKALCSLGKAAGEALALWRDFERLYFANLFLFLNVYAQTNGWDLYDVVLETWERVKLRDWVTYPQTGRPPMPMVGPSRAVQAEGAQADAWYVIQYRHNAEDEVLFWKPDSAGYTRDLNKAGLYTEEEARRKVQLRPEVDVAFPYLAVWFRAHPVVSKDAMAKLPKMFQRKNVYGSSVEIVQGYTPEFSGPQPSAPEFHPVGPPSVTPGPPGIRICARCGYEATFCECPTPVLEAMKPLKSPAPDPFVRPMELPCAGCGVPIVSPDPTTGQTRYACNDCMNACPACGSTKGCGCAHGDA